MRLCRAGVLVLMVLQACSSSSGSRAAPPVASAVTCPSVADNQPEWPSSGRLSPVAPEDASRAAGSFVASYLGPIGDVATATTLDVSPNKCSIPITSGPVIGEVDFVPADEGRVVPSGFSLGGDAGLSLRVQGRHITATYAADCTDCATFEMIVRYGDVTAHIPPTPTATMDADLSGDPSVEGAYVFIARGRDGAITHALGTAVHPGDFAAS